MTVTGLTKFKRWKYRPSWTLTSIFGAIRASFFYPSRRSGRPRSGILKQKLNFLGCSWTRRQSKIQNIEPKLVCRRALCSWSWASRSKGQPWKTSPVKTNVHRAKFEGRSTPSSSAASNVLERCTDAVRGRVPLSSSKLWRFQHVAVKANIRARERNHHDVKKGHSRRAMNQVVEVVH